MENNNDSSSSYNDYINGSQERFLDIEELKTKHIIITDIKNSNNFSIARSFYKKVKSKNILSYYEGKILKYVRYDPENFCLSHSTWASQSLIKDMCVPNKFGIPDILFTFEEFYNFYIKSSSEDIDNK